MKKFEGKTWNTGKFTKEQIIFIHETLEHDLSDREAYDLFEETWPESMKTVRTIKLEREQQTNDPYDFEDYLIQRMKVLEGKGVVRINWTTEEEEHVMEHYAFITERGLKGSTLYKDMILSLEKINGNRRTPGGVQRKLGRLRQKAGIQIKKYHEISLDTLHPNLKLKEGETLDKGKAYKYPFICKVGHETKKTFDSFSNDCPICAIERPLFRHENPLEPGIFYHGLLLDSPLNDFKLGNTLERIGVEVRSKGYGNFEWKEVHKLIGEVEDFEELMKTRYTRTFDNYCTKNPMLEGNGSTECFKKILLPDLEWFINIWTTKGLSEVKIKLDTALKI